MTAFNSVRMKVKPGRQQDFLDEHRKMDANWPGLRHAYIIQADDQTFCVIGEWDDMDALAANRPNMVANLDKFRDILDDLGGDLGVTDPISGPVVLQVK
jgi:quinol monooxygenase YgiN